MTVTTTVRGGDAVITLRHGAGGRAMRQLIGETLAAGHLQTPLPVEGIGLAAMDDGAALRVGDRWLVVTTDRSEERRVGKECRSRWSPYH